MKQSLYVRPSQFEPLEDRIAPAVFVVNTISDNLAGDTYLTLREAIIESNNNAGADTITFDTTVFMPNMLHTIALDIANGDIDITGSLTIKGLGADVIAVKGTATSKIFHIDDTNSAVISTVSLSGLTLTGGHATGLERGGAIFNYKENLTLTNMVIADNTSDGDGGGVYSKSGAAKFVVTNTQFLNNTSTAYGGGLAIFSGKTVQITGSTFSGNTSDDAGGGACILGYSLQGSKPSILIDKSQFTDNTSTLLTGGGLDAILLDGTALTIKSTVATGNTALSDGGGIHIRSGYSASPVTNKITLDALTVSHNSSYVGGGLSVTSSPIGEASVTLSVKNSQFLQNSATLSNGGGIHISGNDRLTANIQSTLVAGNNAYSNGGGVDITESLLSGSKLTISGNHSNRYGGGIHIDGSNVSLSSSSLTGNSGFSGGGIMAVASTYLTLKSVSIDGNKAELAGGGLALTSYSMLNLSASSVTGNHAGVGLNMEIGGGICIYDNAYGGVISKTTISGNSADASGGGVYARLEHPESSLLIQSSTITGNSTGGASGGNGGGVCVYISDPAATATISATTIAKNFSMGAAGGAYFGGVGTSTVTKSNILDNVATTRGGGIENRGTSSLILSGGLISGNVANNGGGVYNLGTAPQVNVTGTKISGNFANAVATSNVNNDNNFYGFVPVTVTSTKGTFIVNSADDVEVSDEFLTLREAIILANESGKAASIGFDASIAGQTIYLNSALPTMIQSMTINGLGVENTIISGQNAQRIFEFDEGNVDVVRTNSISGISFTNGSNAYGAAIRSTESLTLNNTVFSYNDSTGGRGGAVDIVSYNTKLSVSNSRFTAGNVANSGGAIYAKIDGSILITNSMFAGGHAAISGGGVYLRALGEKALVNISKSAFVHNTSSGSAGGAFIQGHAAGTPVTISDTIVTGNVADSAGGLSLYVQALSPSGSKVALTNLTVANNTTTDATTGNGGGLNFKGYAITATVKNGKFLQNTAAKNGGGIAIDGTVTVNMQTALIAGNTANTTSGSAGGIFAFNAANLLTKSATFSGNHAANGGGIALDNSSASLYSSTIIGNDATKGGGIHTTSSSSLTVIKSQISGNSTTSGRGGGVLTENAVLVKISGSTALGNSSGDSGGAMRLFAETIDISKSTFSGNTASSTAGALFVEAINSLKLQTSSFTGNIANGPGGAIEALIDGSSTSLLSGLTVTANSSGIKGGGIYLSGSVARTISKSTFSGNIATDGGGIYNKEAALTLDKGTITSNFASVSGGGVKSTAGFTNAGAKISGNFAPTDPNIG